MAQLKSLGREVSFTVEGKAYTLSRFGLPLLQELTDYAISQMENPFDELSKIIDKLNPELQQKAYEDARLEKQRQKSLNYKSPEVQAFFNSEKGAVKALQLLLRKHHPTISETEAFDLFFLAEQEHGEGYMERLILQTQGEVASTGDFRK